MAMNGPVTLADLSVVPTDHYNSIVNALRNWTGDVDAGTNNLVNLGLLAATTMTIGGAAPLVASYALTGDLGGTLAAPTVTHVGGQTAANVASATLLALAAVSTNTVSTIVKRDGAGNFAAGVITASLTGNVTGNVSGSAASITGTLPTSQLTGALAAAQFPALTGDVTTVAGALATTLATVNANVGSFGDSSHMVALTVDAKGRITAISAMSPSIATSQLTGVLTATQFPALTGDITTVAGALATTLATVNANVGTFGDATHHLTVTVNAKGLITAISAVATNYVLGASALATASLVPYITAAGTLGQDAAFVWDATHHWLGIGMTPDSALSLLNTTKIKHNLSTVSNSIEFWKDATPSYAVQIGMSSTMSGLSNNFIISTYNGTTWADRITVLAGGNVGIGCTPSYALDVAGTVSPLFRVTATAAVSPYLRIQDSAGTPNVWDFGLGWASATDNAFFFYDRRLAQTRFLIDGSGRVGIGPATGVTAPGWTLDVNGAIRSQSLGGVATPTTGTGVEMFYDPPTAGHLKAINRATGAFQKMLVDGNPLVLNSESGVGVGVNCTPAAGVLFQVHVATDQNFRVQQQGGVIGIDALNDAASAWIPFAVTASVVILSPSVVVDIGTPNAASTSTAYDSYLNNGSCGIWVDETNNLLVFRVKYSSGTLKKGTLALS